MCMFVYIGIWTDTVTTNSPGSFTLFLTHVVSNSFSLPYLPVQNLDNQPVSEDVTVYWHWFMANMLLEKESTFL